MGVDQCHRVCRIQRQSSCCFLLRQFVWYLHRSRITQSLCCHSFHPQPCRRQKTTQSKSSTGHRRLHTHANARRDVVLLTVQPLHSMVTATTMLVPPIRQRENLRQTHASVASSKTLRQANFLSSLTT